MNKFRNTALLSPFFVSPFLASLAFVSLAFFSLNSGQSYADAIPPRTLSTSGMGEVRAKADRAEVMMQTSSTQKSASLAKQEVDRRINVFLEKLAAMKIPEKDIVASGLRISPEYEYNNQSRLFSGYTAYRDISVTLNDLDKLDELLEMATDSEIAFIHNIALKATDEDKLKKQAFDNAIADSREKARVLAKAYDAELGAIYSINYQTPQPMFSPKAEMATMRMAADSGGSGQYLHDEITFTDQIQVVFELIIPR